MNQPAAARARLEVAALDETTWPAFAHRIETEKIWAAVGASRSTPRRRTSRAVGSGRRRWSAQVPRGRLGWAQQGSPAELPRIKHRREYERTATDLPDWRITCFYAKGHRRAGVAHRALQGALEQIAHLGGGMVEGQPEDATDPKVSSSFQFTGTWSTFESLGFARVRPLGKRHWVVRKEVSPQASQERPQ